jgi:hypothetical protein
LEFPHGYNSQSGKPLGNVGTHCLTLVGMCLNPKTFFLIQSHLYALTLVMSSKLGNLSEFKIDQKGNSIENNKMQISPKDI